MDHVDAFIASVGRFFAGLGGYVARLWNFWGPRLTDRGFVGAMFANGAVLGFLAIDPAKAQLWQFAIWGAANLFFPLWDNHAAGEKLAPSAKAMQAALAEGDVIRQAMREVADEYNSVASANAPGAAGGH